VERLVTFDSEFTRLLPVRNFTLPGSTN